MLKKEGYLQKFEDILFTDCKCHFMQTKFFKTIFFKVQRKKKVEIFFFFFKKKSCPGLNYKATHSGKFSIMKSINF